MKYSAAFNGLMSAAAFVLPLIAAADSHLGTQSRDGAMSASAHVDFKIVIPQALSLQTAGAERVTIMSNSRNVTLSAGTRATDASIHNHNSVILSAAAGRVIAQDAACAAPSNARDVHAQAVTCTASMP